MFNEARLIYVNGGEKPSGSTEKPSPKKILDAVEERDLPEEAYETIQEINGVHNEMLDFLKTLSKDQVINDVDSDAPAEGSQQERFSTRFDKFLGAINQLLADKANGVLQMPTVDAPGKNPSFDDLKNITDDGVTAIVKVYNSYVAQLSRFKEDVDGENSKKHASALLKQLDDMA